MTPSAPTPQISRWIVSRNFDLLWFMGGAAISLAAVGSYFLFGVSVVALWWIWLLGFDGPHMAAAFTRTYADHQEWKEKRVHLLVSLLSFAIGPVILLIGAYSGSDKPFQSFLAFAAFYGYYHVVRQHYGFLALYKAVNKDYERLDAHLDKWCLYLGCWAPYFYFLLTNPRSRALLLLPNLDQKSPFEQILIPLLVVIWCLCLSAFLYRSVLSRKTEIIWPKVTYFFITVPLHGLLYFFVARYEPVYAQSQGPDQDFLLLSVAITIFHNIQYIALVWFHNRNRYADTNISFGPAGWVNRTAMRYLMVCGLFSMVYLLMACSTGVFPGCQFFVKDRFNGITINQLGLALWWGLALNHYYLDQKIWRIKGDPTLKKNLGLS